MLEPGHYWARVESRHGMGWEPVHVVGLNDVWVIGKEWSDTFAYWSITELRPMPTPED